MGFPGAFPNQYIATIFDDAGRGFPDTGTVVYSPEGVAWYIVKHDSKGPGQTPEGRPYLDVEVMEATDNSGLLNYGTPVHRNIVVHGYTCHGCGKPHFIRWKG